MSTLNLIQDQQLPSISVITAVYNGEKYIEQTINSVLNQDYPNVEYIIIDGGSKDNTNQIISRYKDRLSYYISEKDNGVYDAWNKGLKAAKGTWIAFLGADDYFVDKNVCKKIVPFLERASAAKIRFVYGKVKLVSNDNQQIDTLGQPWEISRKGLFNHMTLPHCSSFHNQLLFKENGPFNTQFRIAGDYEFLLREFTKQGTEALHCDLVVAEMRVGGLSANMKMKLTLARENILALKLNQLKPSAGHHFQILKARLAMALISLLGEKRVNRMSDMIRSLQGKEKMWTSTEKMHG